MKKKRKKISSNKKGKYDIKIGFEGSPDDALKAALHINKSKNMEILDIQTRIDKWESFMKEEFSGKFKASETNHEYQLTPYKPDYKSLFKINGKFHVTCIETNFLLDAEFTSIAQLDSKGINPTAEDLYEAYSQIQLKWVNLILQEGIKENYTIYLSDKTKWSFEMMKPKLDELIYYIGEHE